MILSGPEHLPNYHKWMQDPSLLEATASEPLTIDEEIAMQREWKEDEGKCTFIILARELTPAGDSLGIPPPPAETEIGDKIKSNLHVELPSQFIEQTLDAMIGDVNLFLSEEEAEESGDEQGEQAVPLAPPPLQAELDLMIAVASHRRKNLGTECALMMMHYGATCLHLRRFFVKIKETNHASLKLFKKVGFLECGYAACFGEYELECRCETPELMAAWVESRWQRWRQDTQDPAWASVAAGRGAVRCEERYPCKSGDVETRRCRMYDIYKCPLNLSS